MIETIEKIKDEYRDCFSDLFELMKEKNIDLHFINGFHNYSNILEYEKVMTEEQKEKLKCILENINTLLCKEYNVNTIQANEILNTAYKYCGTGYYNAERLYYYVIRLSDMYKCVRELENK